MENQSNKNTGFSENLDKYVEQEMIKHYGRNVMHNSVQPKASSAPYKKVYSKGFFSVMSIVCAVLFLVGVGVISGVIFSLGDSVNGEMTSNSGYISFVSYNSDLTSSKIMSSNTEVSLQENKSGKTQVSSKENKSSKTQVSSKEKISSKNHISVSQGSSSGATTETADNLIRSRPEYYSLPEVTSESIDTADIPQGSSSRCPNETITTGKKIRAGMGTVLIIMSFVSAVWLYKLKEREEDI